MAAPERFLSEIFGIGRFLTPQSRTDLECKFAKVDPLGSCRDQSKYSNDLPSIRWPRRPREFATF